MHVALYISSASYYRARYYDPASGRFLSEDPIGFSGGINFYEYAGNAPTMLVDPRGFQQSSTASQLNDLLDWMFGTWVPSGTYHSNDPVTRDLSKSPAMQEIRGNYKKAGCEPGLYCGQFRFGQIFTTANLVIQSVGSFCAYLSTDTDGDLQVDAFNEWGLKSLTADFWGHRRSPSLWDMLFHKAHWTWPSSLLNNTQSGPMKKTRYWYHWTEPKPCCKK